MTDIAENVKPFPPMRTDESTVVTGADASRINTHCQNMQDEITRLREANKELLEVAELVEEQCSAFGTVSLTTVRKAQAAISKHKGGPKAVKYGCHVELDPEQEPDDCVMDTGDNADCVNAMALARDGKGKTHCAYWKPSKGEQK